MPRKIWIIAQKEKIDDKDLSNAELNGCSEISNGIPPGLQGVLSKSQLPIVYEELPLPEAPAPAVPVDWTPEIDNLKAEVEALQQQINIAPLRDPLAELDALKAKLKAAGINV